MTPRRAALAAGALALVMVVAAVVALTAGRTSTQARALVGVRAQGLAPAADAPPLPALDAAAWLQSPPLTPASLRGKVVWVDFWDASCVNCRRTFPFLRKLADTYRAAGLVVVGVHTPEFGFEKPAAYVERSAHELGVTWPVAVDPERTVWNAFGNSYWPAQYLVDRAGRVRLAHAGEGDEDVLEADVRTLLDEGGSAGAASVGAVPRTELPGSGGVVQTPERYVGADRGAGTLPAGVVRPGASVERADPDPPAGGVALRGRFLGSAEAVEAQPGASVLLSFTARDVYAVLAPAGPSAEVVVLLDGRPVPPGRRGPDLRVTPTGETVLAVGTEDLHHLLTAPAGDDPAGVLTLTARQAAVRVFTFTFGA